MVNEAQAMVDQISKNLRINADIRVLNNDLMRLYTVIPRKMKDVRACLFNSITDKSSLEAARRLIANEQDTLDTMAGQVTLIKQQREAAKAANTPEAKKKQADLLTSMGLIVEEEKDKKQLDFINKLADSNSRQIKKVFKVTNVGTQKKFESHIEKASDKKRSFLFHGSKNANFFNILQTGLLIRPAGAGWTGSAFGDGIYFASKAQKSIGYTSLDGSYWAKGSDNKAYLAIFEVHVGKQLIVYSSNSGLCASRLKSDGNYDSTYAKPGNGGFLRNEEFIVYNSSQCTIKYLLEIGN
jgi:poly [ADP-ribose] polymerase